MDQLKPLPRAPKSSGSRRVSSRTHADYWKSRLIRRAYSAEGARREVNDLYVRIQHGGRREFFALSTCNRDLGARKAADIYTHLRANGWDATLAKFRPDKEVEPRLDLTVGGYLGAVEITRRLRQRTFLNYRNCLRTIVAEIFGLRPARGENKFDYRAGGNKAWSERIDGIRLARLTPELINAWKRNRVSKAGSSPTAVASARRTVNTYIRCARSLFTKALRAELKGVELPEPPPFSGIELEETGSVKYVSKINVQALIARARADLMVTDPESYKAFLLGLFAGLRKAEIDSLEWAMIDVSAGVIRLEETAWLHLKTSDAAAEVAVDFEVLRELQTLRPLPSTEGTPWPQFILRSPRAPKPESPRPYYRCAETFKRLNEWLRQQGIRANKPLHELRKEVGAVLATEQGIYAASRFLRHSDITTTARHYADQKGRIRVGLGRYLDSAPAGLEAETN